VSNEGKEPGQKIYRFSERKTFKCGECRERFSIKVGTIVEDTKLPLSFPPMNAVSASTVPLSGALKDGCEPHGEGASIAWLRL
jgi:hypothetical protein